MATQATQAQTQGRKKPRRALIGKKVGMTQIYSDAGHWLPVTVLLVGPSTVLQVKTPKKDGYAAVQLGFGDTRKKQKKPQQAYLEKLGLGAKKLVREVPFLDPASLLPPPSGSAVPASGEGGAQIAPGARVGVSFFKDVKRVDVRGFTKGRGFQGVIRRHHFNAGPKSRGTKSIREPGSTGMHTDPGRVHKGKKMPGHLGATFRKARNLDVLKIDEADNLLVVKGAVPGPSGGYVYIQESLR